MKAIGTNLSNTSFIPTRLYRNTWKHGGRYRHGMHHVLLAEDTLLIVTQITTMMMMMRAIAMMATTTGDTVKRAIAMNHGKENNTNLPRHRDPLPLCTSNNRKLTLLPPAEYNPKQWLNDKDF